MLPSVTIQMVAACSFSGSLPRAEYPEPEEGGLQEKGEQALDGQRHTDRSPTNREYEDQFIPN